MREIPHTYRLLLIIIFSFYIALYRLKPTFFDWFHINDTKLADIVICIN